MSYISSSAKNHYKVHLLRSQLEDRESELENAQAIVDERAAELVEAQEILGDMEEIRDVKAQSIVDTKARIKEAEHVASSGENEKGDNTNDDCGDNARTITDPQTGLPLGSKIEVKIEEQDLVDAVFQCRDCMATGDVEGARKFDLIAAQKASEIEPSVTPVFLHCRMRTR